MFQWRKGNLKNNLILISFTVLLLCAALNIRYILAALGKVLSLASPVLYGLAIAYVLNILMRVLEDKVFAFMKRAKRKFVHKMIRPISLILTLAIFLD